MRRGDAGTAELYLARIGPGIDDKLSHRLCRHVGVNRQDDDVGAGVGDRREILHRIERRVLVEKHVAGERRIGADHQVRVGRRIAEAA